jgi:hypothetical protein
MFCDLLNEMNMKAAALKQIDPSFTGISNFVLVTQSR